MNADNDRKREHLEIVLQDPAVDRQGGWFDEIHLTHRALPELALDHVDPSTVIMGKRLSFPLLISAMTGGDADELRQINANLATAAERCQVAFAVGSQRVMFTTPAARASFAVRNWAPTTLVLANLGAVQLNHGCGLAECLEALAVTGGDALCLHLNPLQEAIQPEGNTDFSGLAARIGEIAADLPQPVVLKEVGAGISPADVELVLHRGIRYVDVAGAGGTSWSRIEHYRRQRAGHHDDLGLTFQDWGIPTPLALRLLRPYRHRLTLFASGGLRHGLDLVKAIVLGASLGGLAHPFLAPARESVDAVVTVIERLRREFLTAMFLLGVPHLDQLRGNDALLVPGSGDCGNAATGSPQR